ncbi:MULTISPECIES: LexA family protein [Proteus]|uniref:LexA family transcriptional regulator n=3 Tax=Proteus TaxID=583 RepID=A0A8I1BP01_9GAMM|nr:MULTISPECIES: LexA family transcriptional regulator [Proteus]MBG2915228.1 LexA family transcriptional regulator [Proteus terrae subsp. cibarius]MBG3090762.1 LexA family transcriptional regulator [Proteus terrae subsp. cibarius]MCE9840631.1 LexA family transcriptional regulator [Proteus terrae]NBM54552.1 helix-turn-helix domain-containing protein [Proteus sp. G2669]QIF95123.1 helix-turn-helix domain-containing protein [Proteus vulgaris]
MKLEKKLTTEQLEDCYRLKALYELKKKELNLTQQQIADELDISQGAVGHYLNGRNALNLQIASVFAKKLQVSISEFSPSLAKEITELSKGFDANVSNPRPYRPAPKYPVISFVQAGNWTEACEPYTLSEIDEWYESEVAVQGSAFWLKVEGDSMTAPTGISIPEGSLVLVDTGREPINGSLVIAKLTETNEATFKKLVLDGAKYLKALNPAYPAITINGNCKIIGVVVQMMMRFV